jgi:predicted ChrR family anti-sigma factor
MKHDTNKANHPDTATQEMAALYALYALSTDEERSFSAHLDGCAACRELVASLQDVSASLELCSTPPVAPPAELKRRLLSQIGLEKERAAKTQVWRTWKSTPASSLITVRSDEGEWQTTASPGVSVKPLWVDSERNYVTMLVRMAAGSSYPGHLHAGVEECLVLQGDLQVAGQELHSGDYQRAELGSEHGVQATRDGCLLLIVSSQHDSLR